MIVDPYVKPIIPYTFSNLPKGLGRGEIISFDDAAVIQASPAPSNWPPQSCQEMLHYDSNIF
jgi:hypothetical protein